MSKFVKVSYIVIPIFRYTKNPLIKLYRIIFGLKPYKISIEKFPSYSNWEQDKQYISFLNEPYRLKDAKRSYIPKFHHNF